jgi:hypothetical protein
MEMDDKKHDVPGSDVRAGRGIRRAWCVLDSFVYAKQANFKPVTAMHETGGVVEVLEDRDGQGELNEAWIGRRSHSNPPLLE